MKKKATITQRGVGNGWNSYVIENFGKREREFDRDEIREQAEALICSDLEVTEVSVGGGPYEQTQPLTQLTRSCGSVIQALNEAGARYFFRLNLTGFSTCLKCRVQVCWKAEENAVTVLTEKKRPDWMVRRFVWKIVHREFPTWRPTARQEKQRREMAADPRRGRRLILGASALTAGVLVGILAVVLLFRGSDEFISMLWKLIVFYAGFGLAYCGVQELAKGGANLFVFKQLGIWALILFMLLVIAAWAVEVWLAVMTHSAVLIVVTLLTMLIMVGIMLEIIWKNRKLLLGKYRKTASIDNGQ